MFVAIILLIVHGFTADAQVIGRTPDDSKDSQAKCEQVLADAIKNLGPAPDGIKAEGRCVHVEAPPALVTSEE